MNNFSSPFAFTEPLTQAFPVIEYISFPVKPFIGEYTYVSTCPRSDVKPISVTSKKYSFVSQVLADQAAADDAAAKAIAQRALNPCPGI